MPVKKKVPLAEDHKSKRYWHLYGLQPLSPSKFVDVVQRIIGGNYQLVGRRTKTN